jgi:hypothetical protein
VRRAVRSLLLMPFIVQYVYSCKFSRAARALVTARLPCQPPDFCPPCTCTCSS